MDPSARLERAHEGREVGVGLVAEVEVREDHVRIISATTPSDVVNAVKAKAKVEVHDRFDLEALDVDGDDAAAVGFVVRVGGDVDFAVEIVAAVWVSDGLGGVDFGHGVGV